MPVKVLQREGLRMLTISRQSFSDECRLPGARESHIQADLSSIPALAADVHSRLVNGELAALVNNAGISPKVRKGERMGVADTDADTWMQVLNMTLVSTSLLVRELLPKLKKACASVVNVTSIAGSRVHPFAGVAYAASKAGLAALTRELAHEFGPLGIRSNAISPGEDCNLHPVARHRRVGAARGAIAALWHHRGGG